MRRWSQAQLASAAGIAQSAVARWETGTVSPRFDSILRVLSSAGLTLRCQITEDDRVDWDQIFERLSWSPAERLRYLTDMIAFEERARGARLV
jgi:transcriptional regulator with XRE-family HTH domain